MSGDEGPSPELEAIWGPGGRASTPSAEPVGPGAPAPAPEHPLSADVFIAPVLAAERPRGRGRYAMVAIASVVALSAVAVAGAFALVGGGDPGQTIETAAVPTTPVSDELRESANAFLERWNAGPSTTMPLGEAGVPLHERPTTTTSTTTTIVAPTRPTTQRHTQTQTYTETETSTVRPPRTTTTVAPTLSPDDPRLRGAEEAAQQFVDAMMRRDCEGVWSLLSTRTIEFFEEMGGEEEGESSKDSFCSSLQEEDIPVIRIVPPARPYGKDGALVTLEADGEPETEDLPMLLEGDRWTADLVADFYSDEDQS